MVSDADSNRSESVLPTTEHDADSFPGPRQATAERMDSTSHESSVTQEQWEAMQMVLQKIYAYRTDE